MNRLIEIIAFTPDLDRMRRFYEEGVGLAAAPAGRGVRLETGGVPLTLRLADDGGPRGIELAFESGDLEADLRRLNERGVRTDPVREDGTGRVAGFRDPEGNTVRLLHRPAPVREGPGAAIRSVVLNCQNLRTAVAFYHETLGLPATWEGEHWVELDAGTARLAIHLRPPGGEHPLHAAQKVVWCFDAPDLDTWVEEMRARGLRFDTAPTEEEWGLYAEATDPDGNIAVFRTPREEEPVEETLAEPFESDRAAHAEGMRTPVKKAPGGTSRLVLRPSYRAKKKGGRGVTAPRHKAAAESKRRAAVSSPRGTGPAGSRQKPKVRKDTKRAKAKPATGRKKKAEIATATRRKSAVAGASKRRPVKRAAPRPSRGRRGSR